MKLLVCLAALFTTGSAWCYEKGQWGNYGSGLDAIDGITKACTVLKGTYARLESRQICIQEFNGTKWNFELKVRPQLNQSITGLNQVRLQNVGWKPFNQIGLEQCANGMSKEVHNCLRGGHRSYWRWAYKADPNAGYCVQPDPPPPDKIHQDQEAKGKTERQFTA
ncbi:hypothetical protein GGR55DRAFT_677647 [Xylaria sp. FL0064]|nr:hypothetical protein GGR55DRAFT_677647 [Xylaria sp. FL0064]